MAYLVSILLMVTLAAPFGDVVGSAVALDPGVTVEITVDVTETFEAVLVRPFSSFEELPPTALVALDGSTWRGTVTFPTAENWSFVLDGLEADGETTRSDAVTLIEIGVDPVVVNGDPVLLPPRTLAPGTWWLIGAVVLALLALAALMYWTFATSNDSA